MKTIQECKDEAAKKHGFYEFDNLLWTVDDSPISAEDLNTVVDEAMEMYAAQFREIKFPSNESVNEALGTNSFNIEEIQESAAKMNGACWMKEEIIKLNK